MNIFNKAFLMLSLFSTGLTYTSNHNQRTHTTQKKDTNSPSCAILALDTSASGFILGFSAGYLNPNQIQAYCSSIPTFLYMYGKIKKLESQKKISSSLNDSQKTITLSSGFLFGIWIGSFLKTIQNLRHELG